MSFPIDGPQERGASRLWATYALERAADQAVMPVSFTIATVGITYVGTTVALLVAYGRANVPLLVQLLLPLAPVGLFASLTAIDAVSQRRGAYLDALEDELAALNGLDHCQRSSSLPVPAMRRLSRGALRPTDGSLIRRAALVAAQPFALSAIFIAVYIAYVLNLADPEPAQCVVASVYLALVIRDSWQLIHAKDRGAQLVIALRDPANAPKSAPPPGPALAGDGPPPTHEPPA